MSESQEYRATMESWNSNPKVQMRDAELVKRKIQKLISEGPSVVQVVSDFDSTLSRAHLEGRRIKSSFCVVEDDPRILPIELREVYRAQNEKYVAIEIDPNLSREEKLPHMAKWWNESYATLVEAGIKDEYMRDLCARGEIHLRCQTLDMLKLLEANNIPCLVFSAGLGEIVTYTLEHNKALLSNMTVISNYFKYIDTADGPKAEVPEQLIHTYNKNGEWPLASEYFSGEKVRSRKNVVLLGDNLGDSHMIEGVPHIVQRPCGEDGTEVESNTPPHKDDESFSTVLKIGFLNSKIETRLASFLDHFDVVLLDDQTMNVPLELVKAITAAAAAMAV